MAEFIDFSFVTLTALEYGDIVPEALLERAAVIFEGMTGMLYPALMIAGLVVLELQ
ncbi:MAG: ion channel [Cyclobacteriaceae bacterium]